MTSVISNLPKELLKKKKLAYIEGIRGMAAFMVVIYHYLLAFYPAHASGSVNQVHLHSLELWYYRSPFLFLTNGQLFVFIFFILSGYVLSKKFILEKDFNYLVSAFIRRLPRLYIPVAFSLVVAFLLLKLSLDFNIEASKLTKSIWLGSLKGNLSLISFLKSFLISAMFSGDGSYNTVLWSITIEFYGSMLVFGVLALTCKTKKTILILAFIFFLLLLHNKFEYAAFILGIMLNYSNLFEFKNVLMKRITLIFLILVGLFLGAFPHIYYLSMPTIKGTFFDSLNYDFLIKRNGLINAIGAFLIILAIQKSSKLQHFFSGRILDFFGGISFSMYLIHALILQSFSSYLFIVLQSSFNYNVSFLFQFIPSIILIILLSYIMTIYVDNKSLIASKYFYERIFRIKNKLSYTDDHEKKILKEEVLP